MIQFWQEGENHNSSKRIMQLVLTAFAIVVTSIYLFKTWDYAGGIAIFATIMGVVTTMMGVGKALENQKK